MLPRTVECSQADMKGEGLLERMLRWPPSACSLFAEGQDFDSSPSGITGRRTCDGHLMLWQGVLPPPPFGLRRAGQTMAEKPAYDKVVEVPGLRVEGIDKTFGINGRVSASRLLRARSAMTAISTSSNRC